MNLIGFWSSPNYANDRHLNFKLRDDEKYSILHTNIELQAVELSQVLISSFELRFLLGAGIPFDFQSASIEFDSG